MHTPKGRERSVVTALRSTMKALSLIVTLLLEQIFWVCWQLFSECGMLSLKLPMLYSQVCFRVSIAAHMIFFYFKRKAYRFQLNLFCWLLLQLSATKGGLHFSRLRHGALQVIKLANECRMYCGASSAYATKNCLAFVMPASCILDAMVIEISGEPFSIFTVLQELSTWQKCRKQSACYPFFSTTWLPSQLLWQYRRERAWNLEARS